MTLLNFGNNITNGEGIKFRVDPLAEVYFVSLKLFRIQGATVFWCGRGNILLEEVGNISSGKSGTFFGGVEATLFGGSGSTFFCWGRDIFGGGWG